MRELLTSAQMRAIEQEAMAAGAVTGLQLMERAGQGVVDAILKNWPEFANKEGIAAKVAANPGKSERPWRAAVLCGPGNNGGDGFVIARLLQGLGWQVTVYFLGQAEKLPDDARCNYERWAEIGTVHPVDAFADNGKDVPVDLAVDALFGTGLSRPLTGLEALQSRMAQWGRKAEGPRVVSVDIVSGLCADSGRYIGDVPEDHRMRAHLTVSFHRPKLGHVLSDGALSVGALEVVDIGLDAPQLDGLARAVTRPDLALAKSGAAHKFSHGHALVLSGGFGATGASRLAARAALRIGAGLVTLGPPTEAMAECAAQVTSIMLKELPDAAELESVLQDARITALCLGPGLGRARTQAMVPVALAAKRATVLDADALSAYQDVPEALFSMLHARCVLTPHGGEFARLFPDLAEKLSVAVQQGPAFSKLDAARLAAQRAGCIIVYKGMDTVIAAPDGRGLVHSATQGRAAPWLATAGAGDVLAGLITGLMARGLAPLEAVSAAVWLHVSAALAFGPGLIAEDLPEQMPKILRDLRHRS